MTVSVDDLLALVPPYHAGQPRFMAMLRATLAPFVAARNLAASLPEAYDLDTAIGVQLDATGEWIGRARHVTLPIPGIYFSLDDPMRGLDQGVWKGPYDTAVGVVDLDDETYRRLLRANILAKRWDGTVPAAQAAFDAFFIDPATHVFVQDNAQVPYPRAFFALDTDGQGLDQANFYVPGALSSNLGSVDVSMTIGVSGKIPPPIFLGLLGQGAIPIKPAGVETTYVVTSVDGSPLFGLDVENEFISGLDVGALGVAPEFLLNA